MPAVNEFNLMENPLAGANLIEASAGTGKTYTIAALYLRLLLERHLSVEQILVVTFTEAATGELRERIREKIRAALKVLTGQKTDDVFLTALAAKQGQVEAACRRLTAALRDFDQAAIFTIHGFCMRVLHESAFESGALFDTELVTDQQSFKKEVVEDFWRKHFYLASALFFNYAASKNLSPESLLALLGAKFNQPFLKVIPTFEIPDTSLAEERFQRLFRDLKLAWAKDRAQVEAILLHDLGLNRKQYQPKSIPNWLRAMDEFFELGENNPLLFETFAKFTAEKINTSVKKDHVAPSHPFFDLCDSFQKTHDELTTIFDRRLVGLKKALFAYAREELSGRKKEKNVQSFDDLLLNLHEALAGAAGSELAASIREKFSAALIDEFQDTDPVQYNIFKKIFQHGGSTLFLIGDPKQAIYGFRGADIFAYMEAARQVQNRFTLGKNWRSRPGLIKAINTIFSRVEHPFIYEEIPFLPVAPGEQLSQGHGENNHPSLQLWFVAAGQFKESNKALSKAEAQKLIPKSVAAEISKLLSANAEETMLLPEQPLQAGDIAVLVRKNLEAAVTQKALSALGIPSVLYSTANVFDSAEAVEMGRLLAAVSEPHDEGLLKAALATDLLGVKGEDLDLLLTKNETGWENWLVTFRDYHDLWTAKSFIRMFRRLMMEQNVLNRLMSLPDGERRITNILHIAELLHQASMEKKLSMAGTLKWLADQQNPDAMRLDEHQLRLESDENAVKLVTMHKSKGLEYPVVFCPFTWGGARIKDSNEPLVFHNEADDMNLTLDLGSPERERFKVVAEKEQLAENIRLLYVALTRAKNHCCLVWGRFNEAETSAPAYILHGPPTAENDDPVGAIADKFKTLGDNDLLADLSEIESKSAGAIQITPMPQESGGVFTPMLSRNISLSARKFSAAIDRKWRITSFSSLVWDQPHGAELADRDQLLLPPWQEPEEAAGIADEEKTLNIFTFPRGAAAGTLLHEIFENLDFTDRAGSVSESLVAEKMREHGFESSWQDTLCEMLRNVLDASLDPQLPELRLREIAPTARLNELEFYFPIQRISKDDLYDIFADSDASVALEDFRETIGHLSFSPAKGFMKGFIDLVFQFKDRFYIVDWKSNFLGDRIEHYNQAALNVAMRNEMYILQYHIYALALHQYLQLRLPGYDYEKHFGGVFYLFLRGIDPQRDHHYGIYRDRPSRDLIETLSSRLIGAKSE